MTGSRFITASNTFHPLKGVDYRNQRFLAPFIRVLAV